MYKPKYEGSHALIVGIDRYQFASPLACAKFDAKGIYSTLISQFAFTEANIVLLIDEDATAQRIRQAFYDLVDVAVDSRVLVYFAGHGHTVGGARGEVGFLVPVDGKPNDLSTLIRWDELTRSAELIPAKHVLFLMDACYGGLALKRRVAPIGSLRLLTDMLQRYSRQVLTSGKANEVVSDAGGTRAGHSIFTSHLIDALESGAATSDGVVSASRVMSYVYEKVGNDPHSNQTPHYGFVDGDGDFIFKLPDNFSDQASEVSPVLIPVFSDDRDLEVSPPTLADKIKDLISDPSKKIRLDDIVSAEIRIARDAIAKHSVDVNSSVTKEEFSRLIQVYDDILENLTIVSILLARWGDDSSIRLLEKIIARLAELDRPGSGMVVWLGVSWYPLLRLMYALGIAAVYAGRYEVLGAVVMMPVEQEHRGVSSLLRIVTDKMSQADDGFKLLAGHERHLFPISEYLFQSLQAALEDVLFLGRDYERCFDRFEIMCTLMYADSTDREWGPSGRFVWKQRSLNEPPFNRLVLEAQSAGADWPPLKAGLFKGSRERFERFANGFRDLMTRFPYR